MAITKSLYGELNGVKVYTFTLENKNGMKAEIIEKGATLEKLFVKDKNGNFIDVLSGHDTLEGHTERSDYQGVVVGQYANRIKGGKFSIDGTEYTLTKNDNGITCLHGGGEYSSAVWTGTETSDKSLTFTYFSKDGTDGFPGNVKASVTYELTDNDELILAYNAISDKKTVINLTNHAYFNLNGFDSGDILDHDLQIDADYFTPIDETSIPLKMAEAVNNTPFDFRTTKKIGKDINNTDCVQIKNGNGYDHNFIINDSDGTLKTCAVAKGDKSGITMEVKTTLPGVQFYTGNFLDGTILGKQEKPLTKRCSFCLETQVFPDSPNHQDWCKCVYDKDEEYKSQTVFAFSL
ncbi:MAG: galactose mutarotase [Ruminococcaceae bacterium]|nr:galactose mutarotase [Oscillospiraceae bacterium]